jgi:hypothetical protein
MIQKITDTVQVELDKDGNIQTVRAFNYLKSVFNEPLNEQLFNKNILYNKVYTQHYPGKNQKTEKITTKANKQKAQRRARKINRPKK